MPITRKNTPARTRKNRSGKQNKPYRKAKSNKNANKRRLPKNHKEPKMQVTPGHKGAVVIGLIYANWCGHCQQLKPTWEELKKRIMNDYDNQFTVVEIEADQADKSEQLAKLEQQLDGEKIQANGYPTIVKLDGGKANYYGGSRELNNLLSWATGSNDLMGAVGGYSKEKRSRKSSKKRQHTPVSH